MTEHQATQLAQTVKGKKWHSGGGIWLVIVRLNDNQIIVYSDECIVRYANESNFDNSIAESVYYLSK